MERAERRAARRSVRPATKATPIALEPVDLLAGLGEGIALETDPLPAGVADAAHTEPVVVSVNDVGRLLRIAEPTVRRLIRTPGIEPSAGDPDAEPMPSPFATGMPDKPGD